MAPRAGLPQANTTNGLHCQTRAHGSFGPQRLSGALANPTLNRRASDVAKAATSTIPIIVGTNRVTARAVDML